MQVTRPCRKTTYRNKVAALLTLAEIRRKDRSSAPALEQRAYHCTTCHGWHLTSQPRRTRLAPDIPTKENPMRACEQRHEEE